MPLPIVALVGLPNAGKSTLFNRIIGQRLAVTSDVAGTTRDRQYATVPWNRRIFSMVDTAGLAFFTDQNELESSVKKQITIATQEADLLVLVVDGKTGVEALDRDVLLTFRKIKKPVVVAVNKLDSPNNLEALSAPFYKLGIKAVFAISSVTGRGIGDLLDHIVTHLPENNETPSNDITPSLDQIAVAVVGKPNVGKSSLFNHLLHDERVVVSDIPGTTRTAIDSEVVIDGRTYTLIDTAGLKKKAHRQEQPDLYSGYQTYKSIRRSDVCLFIVDAGEPITSQDQSIAAEIVDQEKGCIVLVNKIDAYKHEQIARAAQYKNNADPDAETDALHAYISHHFPFLWMCPVYFVSAKTGEGVAEAFSQIQGIYERRHKTVSEDALKATLAKWKKISPPRRMLDQKEPKVYSLTQIDTNPPRFELLVNHTPAVSENFRKTIENAIIKDLDFWGTPIKVRLVKKV
ncbi:MAG: ribosome biogenesis GTPase Der [Candidatus Doudnabacteria bacterium]|nr:ribosome biogenesis GTPase Der [Candidatus Doudnabacteria bacterium]